MGILKLAVNGKAGWLGTPVGNYITSMVEPPKDDPSFRYILCTAGETGTGGYNEGVLTDESVTGSAPLVIATAKVVLSGSPFDGLTIHHINSEGRFVGAGIAEAFENDMLQGHYHQTRWNEASIRTSGSLWSDPTNAGANPGANIVHEPISDGTNGTPRYGNRTQPRAHRLVHYRRIL